MEKKLREIKQRVVSALIFSADGKLLMGKKPPDRAAVYQDCWHIPGGVVEGEEDLVALQREVMEEVGIDITPYSATLVDDSGHGESERTLKSGEKIFCKMHFFVFRVDIIDLNADRIKTRASDDLENLSWFLPSELRGVKLTPPSQRLFEKLGYT